MPIGRSRVLAALLLAVAIAGPVGGAGAQPAQPSADILAVAAEDGAAIPYAVWTFWAPPAAVATPDGGAWVFFSAQARKPDGLDTVRLYAARFDPTSNVWLPAQALPGGQIQFGPAAAVDQNGTVHLVFSDRASNAPEALSTLVYTRTNGQGGWELPAPVAPDPNAGHQMMPSLAVDGTGGVHLVWRDQRLLPATARAETPANADLFASDLVDGTWSAPAQVNDRSSPDLNASWPHLAVEGNRRVAIWSVYKGITAEELERPATRMEWSSRPLGELDKWSQPAVLIERGEGETGGRWVDLAPSPTGGLVLVYSRVNRSINDLFVRRLDHDASAWAADVQLLSGDSGYFPSLSVAPDGTAYVAFNNGRNRDVEVGAVMLRQDAEAPSPVLSLTPAEDGLQARATVAIGPNSAPWVVYMHQAVGSTVATEIRVLRGAHMVT